MKEKYKDEKFFFERKWGTINKKKNEKKDKRVYWISKVKFKKLLSYWIFIGGT